MNFLSQFFFQPFMLFGTLLVAVPILIYLFNRQRYKRRSWAAMVFLQRALQKNRKRLRIENLILLLLRCLILFLLAFAMARPYLKNDSLGTLSQGPDNWIFAIDSSYSMNFSDGGRTLFEEAKESLSEMIQEVLEPGDRVSVITFDGIPDEKVSPRALTLENRAEILEEVASLRPSYRSVDIGNSLQLSIEVADKFQQLSGFEAQLESKKLLVFSDFQKRDWLVEGKPKDPAVKNLLKTLKDKHVDVRFADLPSKNRNLSLVDLTVHPRVVSSEVWVEIVATVENTGREDFEAAQLVFLIDGQEERTHVIRVPAGTQVSRTLPYQFVEAGDHSIEVRIQGDNLTTDNRRFKVVHVLNNAEVLLIDGEAGNSPIERETLLLELALMPETNDDGFKRTPYLPVLMPVEQLADEELELQDYVAVVLANVSIEDLPSGFTEKLTRYVEEGGAMLTFLGKNVRGSAYNSAFKPGLESLLPFSLATDSSIPEEPVQMVISDSQHPVAAYFEERGDQSYLGRGFIEVSRYFPTKEIELDSESEVHVWLRYNDPDNSPAVIEKRLGQGASVWFTSSIDTEWNDFAKYPDFIPFIHEYLPYLKARRDGGVNLRLGETLRIIFESQDYAPDVKILPPQDLNVGSENATVALTKNLQEVQGEDRFELVHEETNLPGIYTVRLKRPNSNTIDWTEREHHFAVNLDPSEGKLESVTSAELNEHFPELKVESFNAVEEIAQLSASKESQGGTEFWRSLLWLVLIFLLTESVLAFMFGRRQ